MIEETVVDEGYIQAMEAYRQPNKELDLIGACSESPIVFAKYMLGISLYSWQVDFLSRTVKSMKSGGYDDKEFVAITSRQIGKSTAIAILSLWAALFNKYPGTTGNNTSVGVVSASDTQAKKLLYEIKKFIAMGDTHMKSEYLDEAGKPIFGTEFFSSKLSDKDPNNMSIITFKPHSPSIHGDYLLQGSKSGSVIKSYPPTSVVLGETFTMVVIDEAGKTDRISDQFFYDYIYPTGNSTNAVRIYTSTPWVSSGFFYRMVNPDGEFDDSGADILLFTVDAIKEENPEYYKTVKKIIDQQIEDGKRDEVSRAYYCRFVKGEQSYFNPDKVRECFTKDYDQIHEYDGLCDLGVDFGGQVKSRTVLTVSRITDDGMVERLYHKAYKVQEDLSLLDDITDLRQRFNIDRIIVDDCPAGDVWIRRMELLGWNLHRMNFRSEKVRKYGNFRAFVNRGLIRSYDDKELLTEMLALENANNTKQSYIQPAPGYSDDLIDSFVMSTYFYVTEQQNRVKFFGLGGEFGKEKVNKNDPTVEKSKGSWRRFYM